jgi:uncharacterized protein (DUF924 family)
MADPMTPDSDATTHEPAWVADVLHFWFDELVPAQWFAKDPALDARIRARFQPLHERLAAATDLAADTARVALATLIVLDQFSRNLHRGDARAFAADPLARRLADAAIARGFDAQVAPARRMFFYLPFEHAEDLADQHRAVALFEALGDPRLTRYAEAHRDLIARFGRFPHRNAVLGRESTPEEIESMRGPMGAF